MDRDMKMILGKILGEVYRTQKRVDPRMCPYGEDLLYGLVNGFESTIDKVLFQSEMITKAEEEHVVNVLNTYHIDPAKLQQFKGYYDIEHKLEGGGVSRWKAIEILTKLNLERRFTDVINKMDSSHSPGECRTFKPNEFET